MLSTTGMPFAASNNLTRRTFIVATMEAGSGEGDKTIQSLFDEAPRSKLN